MTISGSGRGDSDDGDDGDDGDPDHRTDHGCPGPIWREAQPVGKLTRVDVPSPPSF